MKLRLCTYRSIAFLGEYHAKQDGRDIVIHNLFRGRVCSFGFVEREDPLLSAWLRTVQHKNTTHNLKTTFSTDTVSFLFLLLLISRNSVLDNTVNS